MSLVVLAFGNLSLIKNVVDPDKRGREISLGTGLAVGLPAIGAVTQGGLAETFGLQIPVLSTMIIGIVYWAWASRNLLKETDNLERLRWSASHPIRKKPADFLPVGRVKRIFKVILKYVIYSYRFYSRAAISTAFNPLGSSIDSKLTF